MCEECAKLDAKIERYRRLVDRAMDQVTRDAAAKLIEDLTAEKARFHPYQDN